MKVAERESMLLAEPHHDGSDAYVLERPDEPGGEAVVRLRVPRETDVDAVALRYVRDGEPRGIRAERDEETDTDVWWSARFAVSNPATSYRWVLAGGDVGYAWVNGAGLVAHDVPDGDDFVLSLGPGGPEWHLGSVVYEIFPDRFETTGLDVDPPVWAIRRAWSEAPTGRGPETPFELFGGDLPGIERRLDHVEALGASVLYLTPIFPATSTHRYDATSFDRVDPLLGGDDALASLTAAAHARGLKVVGDLTLNHTGAGHDWFPAERDLYYFDEALPNGYESWLGVSSLPKLNWGSAELRARMIAVARRWLDEGLDGWRIDVANMTGRYREADLTHGVARAMRGAVGDALLLAEHGHDFRSDLRGDGWHGTMNYAGFLRPVWTWLRGDELPEELRVGFWGVPVGLPRLDGPAVVAAMRAFRAGVPWTSALHSWTLLDSHDTARFRTVAGSRERQLAGVGLQMTTPGVPMVFAGDEIGLEGQWGEDARRTMPWEQPESWDTELLEAYRHLITLRRSSDALARGGIRYALVERDAIAYLRESTSERLLCSAVRDGREPSRFPLATLGCNALEPLYESPSFHVWRLIDG